MNLFKISLKNIKKSWKDYSVYFMTLIIGVAIFYMFNSIGHQKFMTDLSKSGHEIVKMLTAVIEGVSIAVAFILGLLMVYANNFLIRRRKKEFGVYMMLGMGKKEVSKIIIGETLVVGGISLIAGIVIGIFGSQFLSILVGKMFLADVTKYSFLLSGRVVVKTIVNFAVIFLVVLIFNTGTISKYSLLDLLQADKKGEKHVLKNKVLSVVIFIFSIAVILVCYYQVSFGYENLSKTRMFESIIGGIVATFTLFWSLSGFLLEALKRNKKLYFGKLNLFVIRQFCANINSSVVSMAMISLMLFMAVSAFSLGFSVRSTLNANLKEATPVDVTFQYDKGKVSKFFEKENYPVDTWLDSSYVEVPIYKNKKVAIQDTLGNVIATAKEQFPYAKWNSPELILKLSDYNRLAKLYNREPLEMKDDEYVILCDLMVIKDIRDRAIEKGTTLNIGEYELKSAYDSCVDTFIVMAGMSSNMGVVVLPDSVVEDKATKCKKNGYYLAGNYMEKNKQEKRQVDKNIEAICEKDAATDWMAEEVELAPLTYATRNQVIDSNSGLSVLVVFLVLYIGIVFIISCAAILALKALSDSIDSAKKYEVLEKIGAGRKMMECSLFVQTLIHFGLPLVVGVIHSIFGLIFAKNLMVLFDIQNMASGVVITLIMMVVVYGGYMVATYFGCKRVINFE